MSKSEELHVTLGCQHAFADPDKAHYCNYIQVPGLLKTFYPGAKTVDEILLCSGLYSYAIWWKLQEAELLYLLEMAQAGKPLSPEECYQAIKRANRCVETGRIMLSQGVILRSELLRRKGNVNFRFSSGNPSQLEIFQAVTRLSRQLEQSVNNFKLSPALDEPAGERLLNSLKDLILTHVDSHNTIRHDFSTLLWAMHEQPASRVVRFKEVVPAEQLLSYSEATLHKHHPQVFNEPHGSNDELTFITAHQAFEVWFPTVINSIQEATRLLRERPARTWEAEALARRIADIFYLFGRMIHVPQTMTAVDYIEFRDQLKAGSGVESYQFRTIEISAGLRDPRYRRTIERMQLMTPDLALLWDAPSLNNAFMELLEDRNIIQAGDAPEVVALKLAAISTPTGESNPHVDIMALAESLVRFEQNVELWRNHHIAMVTRMIGRKTGTGAATYSQFSQDQDEAFDSLPYLRNTLKYQKIFPALWDARDFLQEHSRLVETGTADV
ncbi:MAG TPA: tryptophan 2,3-dioxygenase family protein [Chloroflexia bacterium]|nr:tryptophan 2,3-dioxygenase family protein [Chloroflexia bacterium]